MSDEEVARAVLRRLIDWGYCSTTDGRLIIDGTLYVDRADTPDALVTQAEIDAFNRWIGPPE